MFSRPDMGQFVRERGYLCGLAVGTVDEHQWGKIVGQGITAELVRVELATGVVADDSARHHEHAESVGRRAILNSSGSTLTTPCREPVKFFPDRFGVAGLP